MARWWFPWLVPTFMVANVVFFVVSMYQNDCPQQSLSPSASCSASFLNRFSFNPSHSKLIKMGALYLEKADRIHQAWRLFSCMWLHGGVSHLLFNMLELFTCGVLLEMKSGFARVGLLYVISGLGCSLLSALFEQPSVTVGASGAIFGLIGGRLSVLIKHPNKFGKKLILIAKIIFYLAHGISDPTVCNFGHIGGLVSGFLLGFVLLIHPRSKRVSRKKSHSAPPVQQKHNPYQYALWIISFMLLSVGFIGGLVLFLKRVDKNDYCSWCHYLSGVPISTGSCEPFEIS